MTLVIATDEAGYGPKLGPLVIVASAWDFQVANLSHFATEDFESAISNRLTVAGDKLELADSKKLFQRSSSLSLRPLELPIVAWLCDLNLDPFPRTLQALLKVLASSDSNGLCKKPWFGELASSFPMDSTLFGGENTRLLNSDRIRLVGLRARVIDAKEFNNLSNDCGNKATLLSEATVGLAKELIDEHLSSHDKLDTTSYVFSDRHGGRQRYAGLLQQFFSDGIPAIIEEAKACSRYRFSHNEKSIDWRFSVKGDSFAPVAFSSMVAKYLRERMMQHFNDFWLSAHGEGLRPTAGYPVDADRFCDQIAATAKRLGIAADNYVRCR